MVGNASPFGQHLRTWRQRRRLSQLDLALEAEISARHLSFLETGRAQPSREMVLLLANRLETPLRDRNLMLAAAGFAPVFSHRGLDDPALETARRAVDLILKGHEPFPALAVDRHWNMVAANHSVALLLEGLAPALLAPPINVMRLALHPDGLAPRIANLAEWRGHLLERLTEQAQSVGDGSLDALLRELHGFPCPAASDLRATDLGGIAVTLKLVVGERMLSFISMTTVFGAATDVTLAEMTLETFLPADQETADALLGMNRA
ncbi:helix-turn-helix transcriptional regulator [Brevundimonas sp.]|uniref:helix-turn-helix domain-containing protein n=1 Tax=Brevundimonas sp. TaxID=1871086 RepID=UPI00286BC2B7|nr:helix-turn-helix transcriptional regulator [Brevundimonas sp.]